MQIDTSHPDRPGKHPAAHFPEAEQPQKTTLKAMKFSPIDGLIGIWFLGMVSVPVSLWTIGPAALPWAISINVVLLATAMTWHLFNHWGMRKTLETLALVLSISWLLEFVGSSTGFPFGEYDYTGFFQPQLGYVPLIIPLAWLMMLPPAWVIAQLLVPRNHLARFAVAAFAFTAWDLFLDPQMVGWGVWQWVEEGGYFGIPWQNYAGWLFGAFLLTVAVRPSPLPVTRPLVVYGLTWFLQTVGLMFFWAMPGPALVGMVVMGAFLWTAVYRLRRQGDPFDASKTGSTVGFHQPT